MSVEQKHRVREIKSSPVKSPESDVWCVMYICIFYFSIIQFYNSTMIYEY